MATISTPGVGARGKRPRPTGPPGPAGSRGDRLVKKGTGSLSCTLAPPLPGRRVQPRLSLCICKMGRWVQHRAVREKRGAGAGGLRPDECKRVRTRSGVRGAAQGGAESLSPRARPQPRVCACALWRGWAGPQAGPPRSPAFPAAAGTDVAAVRAAILWERNQRLARSSSLAAAAEGEAPGREPGAGAGRRVAGTGPGHGRPCPPWRRGGEGRGEVGPGRAGAE